MGSFIAVLASTASYPYWEAVQEADSLAELAANPYYTAGQNTPKTKSAADRRQGTKTITDTATNSPATAVMVELIAARVGVRRAVRLYRLQRSPGNRVPPKALRFTANVQPRKK